MSRRPPPTSLREALGQGAVKAVIVWSSFTGVYFLALAIVPMRLSS